MSRELGHFKKFNYIAVGITGISGSHVSEGLRSAVKYDTGGTESLELSLDVRNFDAEMTEAMIADGPVGAGRLGYREGKLKQFQMLVPHP